MITLSMYEIRYVIVDMMGESDQRNWSCLAEDANIAIKKFWSSDSIPEDTACVLLHDVSPVSDDYVELSEWTVDLPSGKCT